MHGGLLAGDAGLAWAYAPPPVMLPSKGPESSEEKTSSTEKSGGANMSKRLTPDTAEEGSENRSRAGENGACVRGCMAMGAVADA